MSPSPPNAAPANAAFEPAQLARSLEKFLSEHPRAALLENGRVLFEMPSSHYSLSTEHGRCVLQFWSEERNLIRTVVGLEGRKETLRILVRRLGTHRPQSLDLVADRSRHIPAARAGSRRAYLGLLERVLLRAFNDYKVEGLRSAMDLEHSFGPAYARGLLARGRQSWAVIGTGAGETQATIDGMLTLGILWLARCRQRSGGKAVLQGLRVIAPQGTSAVIQARMAWLNPNLGAWELYELCEASEELMRIDASREGDLQMRLVDAFDTSAAIERARSGLERLKGLLPQGMKDRVEVRAKSANEVALALYGLEFAHVRQGFAASSFRREDRITFGAGGNETPLEAGSEALWADLMERLSVQRHPGGNACDPLFRLQPEAWLEAVLREDLSEIEPSLRSAPVYVQVPAFSGADRGLSDLLTATTGGRLAVVELKAEEDLHLPLRGLDYWVRVRWLNEQRSPGGGPGELERSGYFPGRPIAAAPPLLYYVVPALRVHPSMETVLAHFSPQVPWVLIALNEGWRSERKVIFRKKPPVPEL